MTVENNAFVYIEMVDGESPRFPAYVPDDRRSACEVVEPRFTYETAQTVAAWNNALVEQDDDNPFLGFARNGNILEFTKESPIFPTVIYEQDGDGRYALGAGRWAWQIDSSRAPEGRVDV
ncbi:hypothetical protein [Amycolatopsis anabasis]|uniref:hypothetical protein n=1 Tax=Amycolatopsis anabasis TaxID=1840409 RepID=UPI00131BFB1F|nr:hypothetical protein [Amycolatopsis anabasis]